MKMLRLLVATAATTSICLSLLASSTVLAGQGDSSSTDEATKISPKVTQQSLADQRLILEGPTTNAAAPGLTYVQIIAVNSTNYGWEYPPTGQLTTDGDHGGSEMIVVVQEMGYSSSRTAKFNFLTLPASANYDNQRICGTPSNPNTTCSPGETIIGYLRYYDVSGNQSGTFEYQSSSTNGPYTTMSDRIRIK